MKLDWVCSCEMRGTATFEEWNFKKVAALICEEHNRISPYGKGWFPPELVGYGWGNLDIEVSEDLKFAKLRHIQ